MTTQTTNKAPIYELGFCAKKGTDGRGSEILGSMVRLAAVWERKDATKGGLVDFYTKAASPFGALGEGVVFLLPPNLPEQRDANKSYPIYELGFCAKRGKTQSGQDILGTMVRVATVWPRKDGRYRRLPPRSRLALRQSRRWRGVSNSHRNQRQHSPSCQSSKRAA